MHQIRVPASVRSFVRSLLGWSLTLRLYRRRSTCQVLLALFFPSLIITERHAVHVACLSNVDARLYSILRALINNIARSVRPYFSILYIIPGRGGTKIEIVLHRNQLPISGSKKSNVTVDTELVCEMIYFEKIE